MANALSPTPEKRRLAHKLAGVRRERDGQRGFALLLVFAMAAAAAIFLYMQLPRVAFEAQRDREELLIQRGKDYRRAIELYVRKNNKYPSTLEELERQQDLRFLRRRHKDPLTGKDDWRIVRINAAGQLENSLVQKKQVPGRKPGDQELLADDQNVAENTALARQRSGDQLLANADFPGGGGATAPPGDPANPGLEGSGQQNPSQRNPLDDGLVPLLDATGNVVTPTTQGAPAQTPQVGVTLLPDGTRAETTARVDGGPEGAGGPRLGPGGIPIIENPVAVVGLTSNPAASGAGGTPQAVGAPPRSGSANNAQSAAEIIGGLLTTPVPGGLQGIQQRRGITPGTAGGAQGFGAGIAGVASRFEMRGIKVYDEQDSIHKWEFVFDARQQASKNAQAQGGARNPSMPGSGGAPTFNPGGRTGGQRGGSPGMPGQGNINPPPRPR